ncbi:zinc finger and BTB domain-containing protein 5 [Grus japonensis]|uniref:Zinc finger and BTB domain-containing protein 5 n=1 Tax=Grus japonensis TaxID=30415 RepID=A0ABC9Y800_GRUJA
MEKTTVKQAVPLQPVEVDKEQRFHLQPMEDPTLEQFVKNCSPWEGLTLEKFMEDCPPVRGTHAGVGEEREEEGAAKTTYHELAAAPIPCPPVLLVGRR